MGKYIEKRDYEVLRNYYFGLGKTNIIWVDTLKEMDKKGLIKKIYEIIDNDYNESWFLVKDVNNKNYILKSKHGISYSSDVMKEFKNKYIFYKTTTDLIKLYDSNIYPIIFKINCNDFNLYYDEERNINSAFFSNYYCCCKNKYKAVREYRNKVEMAIFIKEEDAVYWCSDFNTSKKRATESNIKPVNLMKKVYIYNF